MLRFPVVLTPDENGTVIAEVPDIPGTITFGQGEAEALDMALDAALTMLSAMMDDSSDSHMLMVIDRPDQKKAWETYVRMYLEAP